MALALAAFLAGWHGGRVTIVVGIALAVGWAAVAVLISRDPTGAGAFADCWPRCTVLQEVVGWLVLLCPLMLLVLLIGSFAARLRRRAKH